MTLNYTFAIDAPEINMPIIIMTCILCSIRWKKSSSGLIVLILKKKKKMRNKNCKYKISDVYYTICVYDSYPYNTIYA